MLLIAIGVAVVGYRRAARDTAAGRYVDVRGWLTASTALVFAVTGITFVVGVAHDAKFLSELPAGTDRSQALVDGHRACHWLQAQPWGPSPGPANGPHPRQQLLASVHLPLTGPALRRGQVLGPAAGPLHQTCRSDDAGADATVGDGAIQGSVLRAGVV